MDIEALKRELTTMSECITANDTPAAYGAIGATSNALVDEACTKIRAYVSVLCSHKDSNDRVAFEVGAPIAAQGQKGLYLFDLPYNGREVAVFVMVDGRFMETDKPVVYQSQLNELKVEYIARNYGAERCCAAILDAVRGLKEHYKNVVNSNRAAIGLEAVSLS